MSGLARLMVDHCTAMLLLVDPLNLRIVQANAPVSSTLGYDSQALLSMQITDIESALQDVFYWEEVRGGQPREVVDQEGQYRRADGELLTVSKSISMISHDGGKLLLVQALPARDERPTQDALAHTMSQLRATLESTGNGILVIDWHGRIDSMNRLFGRMWDVSDELLDVNNGHELLNLLAARVTETELFRARLGAIVDSRATQDTFHHLDGRVFEVSSRPQKLGEQVIGRVFGFHDITERERTETALRETRDQLEARVLARTADLHAANATLQLEKAQQALLISRLEAAQNQLLQSERMASIGQLAAGVAHEINNPVGFVNSNLGALHRYVENLLALLTAYEKAETGLAEVTLQPIQQIKQDIDLDYLRQDLPSLLAESQDGLRRVTRIVQDLKDFSHVGESERQWADLEAGLESTLRVVANEIKYKAVVVRDYCGLPPVECHPFQLNQVFMNLLVNAAHAIEERGTITLCTGHDERELWIEVRDTGKGIAAENLARIFEPFFTTKPVGQGTGLGLSLSYGIVQKHGGRIEVQSEAGCGTSFRVVLPKCPPAATQGSSERTDHVPTR